MLRQGIAVVYESAGAEYGPWGLEEMKRIEQEARRAKRGLWAQKGRIETPGEYKKRHKMAGEEDMQAATGGKDARGGGGGGLWAWVASWIRR